jgi:hypothetical protein
MVPDTGVRVFIVAAALLLADKRYLQTCLVVAFLTQGLHLTALV